MIVFVATSRHVTSNRAFKLLAIEKHPQAHGSLKIRLTDEQLEALRACAKGISLRFENPEIVKALLADGYVSKNSRRHNGYDKGSRLLT